jgi:hypothetical protein
MAYNQPAKAEGTPEAGMTFLEVRGPAGEVPLRFPVTVQNLSAGVVTLEVERSLDGVDWESLAGRSSSLRLPSIGGVKGGVMEGIVSWTSFSENGEPRLMLGLQLADAKINPAGSLRAPRDLKVFWDRWEEIHASPRRVLTEPRIYLMGLSLIMAGMGLQWAEIKPVKYSGYILWFSGCLIISAKILWSLWSGSQSPEEGSS